MKTTSILEKTETVKKRGLSGSSLKIMAIISMLIDHIGGVLILMGVFNRLIPNAYKIPICRNPNFNMIYMFMRGIGRIAFPIFCFLLVEGYIHTSNKKKYALRMFVFALISEMPFNLAFGNKALIPVSRLNNVFFTLFLGIGLMYTIECINNKKMNKILNLLAIILAVVIFGAIAVFIKCDFKYCSMPCVALLYIFREKRAFQILSMIVIFLFEVPGSFGIVYLSLITIYFYNGERGLKLKYFFYAFYPVHLLILYFIRVYLATSLL